MTDATVEIGIEPWADSVILRPDEKVEFHYEEPADVGFALLERGAGIDLVSENIKVVVRGEERILVADGKVKI